MQRSSTILSWIGRITVLITTDYGIGQNVLELANHDHRQNATINFHVGYDFQRNIIAYIKLRAIAIAIEITMTIFIYRENLREGNIERGR